ncbi:cyanophycinase [Paenibacillus sp. S3N08]|uniref:Cyanophycinase n=1 Tax=Paenibacillus agricola TaxID=2716264 RepID=A0ABX0JIJ0_9BACL|nr:cyanophycinase [Paenibacillus agricola]
MVQYLEIGPARGSLFISGGSDKMNFSKFVELVGDPDAPVIIIPTAWEGNNFNPNSRRMKYFRDNGLNNISILHTRDRQEADTENFIQPLKEAKAVYLDGGRQWRLSDAYLQTRVHSELFALLDRGGVIGGGSAGASIQASFLARGDTKTNEIMMGDHLEGFGFLKNMVIDQHLLKRNRQFDLIEIIEAHPHLLGIGIDEDTAIIVTRDEFEVIGSGYVAIYDYSKIVSPRGKFYFLSPGDRYNLKSREAFHVQIKPVERVTAGIWSEQAE